MQDGPAFDFKAQGLPKGLKIDRGFGRIFGKPKVAGVFTVTVSAAYYLNAVKTPVDPITFTIDVRAFPGVLSSQYLGLIGRHDVLNGGLGSRVDMAISATGVATGKVLTGKSAMNFSVPVTFDETLTQATLNAPLKNFGMLTAVIDTSDGSATGSITKETGESAPVTWWIAASNLDSFTGSYAAYLEQLDPNLALPQNHGFLRFTIDANGSYKLTGETSDGGPGLNTTALVGAGGEVLIYHQSGGHSLIGVLTITTGANAPADNTLGGTLDWKVDPANRTMGAYGNGFDAVTLTAVGGTYAPPGAGQVALGIPIPAGANPPANATLTLIPSLADVDTPVFTDDIVIAPGAKNRTTGTPVLPTVLQGNLTFVDASGSFAGTFIVPGVTPDLDRSVPFAGQIVTVGSVTRGYGYFLMPLKPAPGGTLEGAAHYTGSVLLQKKQAALHRFG